MSKTILATMLIAVLLIIVAVIADSTFVAGGSGVVLMVGIVYSYVVAKRDAERGAGAA
ncbi:MAG: hypothetical protein ABJ242_11640 [Marinomonas sp.]